MLSLSPSGLASLTESHPWNVCLWARCQFSTFEQCQDWLKRLNNAIRPPSKIEDLFSFAYHAWCMEVYASEKEQHGDLCRPGTWEQPWHHQSSTWISPEITGMGLIQSVRCRTSTVLFTMAAAFSLNHFGLVVTCFVWSSDLQDGCWGEGSP